MEAMSGVIRCANKFLNLFLSVLIILALLYGGFSLWDTYRIYADAGIDSELLQYKPTGEASDPSLSELIALNGDVRGWIVVDDTGIDYPLVQGATNLEYLNADVYGEYSLSGSIFLDCRNAADFSDFYTLLYGHHMEKGAMFGDLGNFHKTDYFETHTTGTLYAPNKTYHLELYACLAVDAYDARVFDPTAQDADFLKYIRENAAQYREINVSAEDRIIGLSTCADATTNGRTVVYARMTELADSGGDKK